MSRMLYTRICMDCGKVMHNAGPNRKRCPECVRKRTNAQAKLHYHEEYAAMKRNSAKKTVEQRYDEHVAEVNRLEAIGGSYGKGRLKEYLAAQNKKPAGAGTPTDCKG